jgi:tripartite-type tricarboxylate transporter receptor subunit TctC
MKRLFAVIILVAGVTSAGAQMYPAKPVKIIVPTAPGGGYDFIARLLSEKLSADLGQGFIVENRTGAGLVVGSQAAAAAAPDGYTLLIGGLANMAFSPALFKSIGYDPVADFVPVALVGSFTYALVARKDLPQSSLHEVIDFARQNPGKLTIAHAGTGSGQYVAAVMLKQLAKIDLLEVPYKGAQPAYTDLLAGRVDLFFDNTTTTRPFVADGRVKPLATSGTERDALLPNVPTGREAGLEGMVLDSWIGLFAPSKTPRPVVEKLRAATIKAVEAAETKKRLETNGWRTLSMPEAQTQSFVRSEAQRWPKFLQQAGVKPE